MWYRYGIFYLRNNRQVSMCLTMCLRVNSLSITNCSLPSSLGLDSTTSPARCIRSCTLVHHKIRPKRKRNKRKKKILGFLYPLRISRSRVGRRVVGCQSSPPSKILGFPYPSRISRSRAGRRVVGCQSSSRPPLSPSPSATHFLSLPHASVSPRK